MQRIADLIQGLEIDLARGAGGTVVSDLTDDSRRVTPGALFIAREGAMRDGREFIADAIARGASAIVCDQWKPGWPGTAAWLRPRVNRGVAAGLARRFFGDPSRSLHLSGITGTNGKTTAAYITRHLLNRAGIRCGLMGTVEIDDGLSPVAADLTTPGVIEVNRFLAAMVRNGCRAAVMEVSSHALAQGRVAELRFAAAAFTNLSGDHLDYHGSMDEYAAAKALLFDSLDDTAVAVVNADDACAPAMLRHCAATVIRAGMRTERGEARASIHEMRSSSTRAAFAGPWGEFEIDLPLVGAHNVENALHALCLSWSAGVGADDLRRGLVTVQAPPGRLEPVTSAGDEFTILVDYAHTDAALRNVLEALRPLESDGARLITVFGCGGDRDRTKRPRMARAACEGSDRVIVTSDNPRTEDPLAIIAEVLSGVPASSAPHVESIPDRRAAIHAAVARARAGDIVLIAGKGHEDYQIIGARKFPFDDRTIARESLRARRGELVAA